LKNKSNQGILILLLSGVGVAILLVAIILRPADTAESNSNKPNFYQFEAADLADGLTLFEVDTAVSTASYTIDEILRGTPKTVIGTTDEVAGQLVLNFDDPASLQFSEFALLAQTFKTDSSLRDSAVRDRILFTNSHPFIMFTPNEIDGLPNQIVLGESINFTIMGDLSITTVSNPVTFAARATAVSPTEITLQATSTINRADFDLVIPNVPGVANVSEELLLTLDLTLTAVTP
jgi:polyisoprenoid-binding protein YceI